MPLPSKRNIPPVSEADVSRIVWHFGLFSLAAVVFAFPLAHSDWVPPICGRMACVAAFVGVGAGLWAASRMGSARIFRATIPAIVAVVGWIAFALWYIAGG